MTQTSLWSRCRSAAVIILMMTCWLLLPVSPANASDDVSDGAEVQENACIVPPLKTDEPPGDGIQPVEVSIWIAVLDIMGVEDVSQQIEIDMVTQAEWQDDRLVGLAGCRIGVTEVWSPQLRLVNSSNLRLAFVNARDQVIIGEGGKVVYRQRGTGRVSSYHSLRHFPFDRHDFEIYLTPDVPGHFPIVLETKPEDTWVANRLNIEGWRVEGVSISTDEFSLHDKGEPLYTAKLTISAERNPEFYVYRVLVLLFLVVGMSWVIFWVPPSRFEFQIGIGATAMLTAIAFNLALSGQLPPVGYLTTLDKMMVWAIVLVFLSIIEALVAGRMVMKDREREALAIDRACRIIFPVLLLGGWLGLIWF